TAAACRAPGAVGPTKAQNRRSGVAAALPEEVVVGLDLGVPLRLLEQLLVRAGPHVEELRRLEGLVLVLGVLLGVLDADDETLEVPSGPDGDDVARGQAHLPAVARVEAVDRVRDLPDLSAEAVGVGLRIELRLERVARHDLVGLLPDALEQT